MKSLLWPLLVTLLLVFTQGASAEDVRSKNLDKLTELGFTVAPSLPTERPQLKKLRPVSEIEMRLEALQVFVLWVVAPPDQDVAPLKKRALEGDLKDWLTEKEKNIIRLEQTEARSKYLDSVGWQMENMWALAWVLGFETEPALTGQIQGQLARDLVFKFCRTDVPKKVRNLQLIIQTEDLFYCAHNAVRSAQQGGKTVPEGYDPKEDGGGVHERRHALTWCLSPGVEWDNTDLST